MDYIRKNPVYQDFMSQADLVNVHCFAQHYYFVKGILFFNHIDAILKSS
jgi:hypothetical protein